MTPSKSPFKAVVVVVVVVLLDAELCCFCALGSTVKPETVVVTAKRSVVEVFMLRGVDTILLVSFVGNLLRQSLSCLTPDICICLGPIL